MNIDRALALYGVYEPQTTRAFRRLIEPGMTCLDVGANFGYFTLLMGQLVGPKGHVHAFEPVSQHFARLVRHIELNPTLPATPHQLGLGERDGRVAIYSSKDTASITRTAFKADTSGRVRQEDVQVLALDSLHERGEFRSVDFIKVDVDGFELEFLAGAQTTLQTQRPILCIEFAPWVLQDRDRSARDLVERLVATHPHLFDVAGREWTVSELSNDTARLEEHNLIALPKPWRELAR
jgi:FkbM family methyltransferase